MCIRDRFITIGTPITKNKKASIEDQANARAHRIGQKKRVLVTKLVYRGSIEEYMLEKQDYKRTMSDLAIKGDDGTAEIKIKEMKEYLLKSKTN